MRRLPLSTLALILCLALAAFLPAQAESGSLLVSAASSLTDALTTLKPAAERAAGMPIEFNFGGSGALRMQIEQGAPVDLFFSASAADMDKLAAKGLVLAASRVDLLSNTIVLIGDPSLPPCAGAEDAARLLLGAKLVAIGNPDSVPAGQYASQAFEWLGVSKGLEKRLVLGGNVRDVLAFVASGSAPLGVVFQTDAASPQAGAKTRILYRFPAASLRQAIVYPLGAIAGDEGSPSQDRRDAVRRLVAFLEGPEAKRVFTAAGFVFLE